MLTALRGSAAADTSKAWATARDQLPATTRAVAVIDVAAGAKTQIGMKLLEVAIKEERDIRELYGLVKKVCQADPVSLVEGIVIAGDPATGRGVLFAQLSIDRAKVAACIEGALRSVGPKKPQLKTDGNITQINYESDTLYLAWVAPQVVAISFEPEKKDALLAWIGQKGALAKTGVPAQIAKVDTKAVAWGALALDKPLDDDDFSVVSAHGAVTQGKAGLSISVRGTFSDAKKAKETHGKMQKDLKEEAASKRTPPALKRLLSAVVLAAKDAELTISASASEADVIAVLSELMK